MSQPHAIDPRGPQFAASLTTVVLATILLTAPSPLGLLLLGTQALLFLTGALLGVQHTPWAVLFRRVIRPRLAAPAHLEDPRPPRFAQAVGLAFTLVALVAYLAGATSVGALAVGFALAAALLNAAFGLCLGCELYLTLKKLTTPKLRESAVLALD
ncbi:MAG TPA: DUF4395 domain-containing protein [Marmoricola sp.]|nr:DUF4395 domain-containing protein [Marmoricola sp.]